MSFPEPTRIRRVLIPNPALEEQSLAHTVFADLAHKVAGPLDNEARRSDVPVYLSKQNLARGVWRFVNEADVSEVLARRGVEIIAPETLGFAGQIDLFRTRSVVCAAVGSGLHTSVFAARPPRIIAYNRDPNVLSNYMLTDGANGTDARYFYPSEGFTTVDATPEFTLNCVLNDPVQVGEDLLRLIDSPG